ncbi:MAG: hypothetical protein PHN74_01385 [Candidatus Pacebacteria bacterium]|nr:hypothetical protein [Candidatus Paceibacterota bacterium]
MKNINFKNQKGQVIIEAMVALTVAIVGLLGVFSLVSKSLSLNVFVSDKYIAANLSSEGIELIKNLVDKNIVNSRPWNEGIEDDDYKIDYKDESLAGNEYNGNGTLMFSGDEGYNYSDGEPTKYDRKITIENVSVDEIKVVSTVSWIGRGGSASDKLSVVLEDHFFRWRYE